MRLYIACSSLDFNSIMATESISPQSFYSVRGFGIKNFYGKCSGFLRNSILLFDQFPDFSLDQKVEAHLPMVIEIDDVRPEDVKSVRQLKGFNVYQTSKSLYLSPINTSIFFFSERDRSSTLSKAESFRETKIGLYKNRIQVVRRDVRRVKISQDTFKGIVDYTRENTASINFDRRLNRAKGFYASYMMGAVNGFTDDSIQLINVTRQISNLLSSQKAKDVYDPSKVAPFAKSAASFARRLDPQCKEESARIKEFLQITKAYELLSPNEDSILSWLKEAHLYDVITTRLGIRPQLDIEQLTRSMKIIDIDLVIDKLNQYVNSIVDRQSNLKAGVNSLRFNQDLNTVDIQDQHIAPIDIQILQILFNLYSNLALSSDNIRENRTGYINEAGAALKQMLDERDFVPVQSYLYGLLDNLEKAVPFDVHETQLLSLQGFALFMRFPDGELEKLANAVISEGIADARYAFAFWGLFYGFSRIPYFEYERFIASLSHEEQTAFFDRLRQIQDASSCIESPYMDPVSNEKEADEEVVEEDLPEFTTPETSDENKELEDKTALAPGEDLPPDIIPEDTKPQEVDSAEEKLNRHEYSDLLDYAARLVEKYAPSKKSADFIDYYTDKIEKVFNGQVTLAAIKNGIKDISSPRGTKSTWDKVKKDILQEIKRLEDEGDTLFRLNNPTVIDSLSCTQGLDEKILKRLNDNWDYTGRKHQDNYGHIMHFLNLCRQEGRGDLKYSQVLKGRFDEKFYANLEYELKKYYGL